VFAVINLLGRLGVAGLDAELGVTIFMGIPASLFGTLCMSPILLALEGEGSTETRTRVSRVSGSTKKSTKILGITMKNLNASNQFVPPIAGTLIVFYLVGLYSIFLRGSPLGSKFFLKSPDETLSGILGKNKDILGLMAEKAKLNSRAYVISTRLQECGFWTSKIIFGPILHVSGLVATLPSAYFLLSEIWYGAKRSRAQILVALPLNVLPVIICRGTPTIRAVGIILLLGGMMQLSLSRQNGNRSHMRI